MAIRGAPPKSAADKWLAGTIRPSRVRRAVTQLPPLDPKPPSGLSAAAKVEWKRILEEAVPTGHFTAADQAILMQVCEVCASVGKLTRKLHRVGMTFVTPKGYVAQRPEVGILNRQRVLLVQLLMHCGFTPASRRRVESPTGVGRAPLPGDEYFDDGPTEKLLFHRKSPRKPAS